MDARPPVAARLRRIARDDSLPNSGASVHVAAPSSANADDVTFEIRNLSNRLGAAAWARLRATVHFLDFAYESVARAQGPDGVTLRLRTVRRGRVSAHAAFRPRAAYHTVAYLVGIGLCVGYLYWYATRCALDGRAITAS
jgi:hypothetical protein